MASSFYQNFDEHRWIIQIRRSLEEDLEEDIDVPVCIFNVPRDLRASHPDSYEPQQVAIGPYHHWRPGLYDMERYKLASAKRMQKQLHNLKFEQFVDEFTMLEHRIRACYHKYLDFRGETLVWMMAMDSSFLLEFLQVYTVRERRMLFSGVSSRKSAHYAILRDIVMLENQIPLFLLRKMLELQFSSSEASDSVLSSMLVGFCKELSPFKTMEEELSNVRVMDCAHCLDFLYHVIVPELDGQQEITEIDDEDGETAKETDENCIRRLLPKIYKGAVHLVKIVIFSKMIKAALKLPWKFISNLPGISFVKTPIEYLFFTEYQADRKQETGGDCINQPPLMEEITIPSVTELREAGFQFSPAREGIMSIAFDDQKSTIYLPTITLDVNADTVLRNLVAYESCSASGPLVLARYTELMNGIIDTGEDAKHLRERGIILNRLKSDEEVADLWNGMTKSVRLTKVPFLDKVIEDVNQCFRRRWFKVKVLRFLKLCVFGSWPVFMSMVVVMLLFLVTLQAFSRITRTKRGQ